MCRSRESRRRVQDSPQSRHKQGVRTADTDAADAETTEGMPMPERAEPQAADGAGGDDALAWFTAVVREHSTALVRYFARRGPRQDAEDLAAEVFATAWRRRADVPREAVLPWLYRTAGFTLANHRRKLVDLPVEDVPERGERRVAEDPELSALFDDELRGALMSVATGASSCCTRGRASTARRSPPCSASRDRGRMPHSHEPARDSAKPGASA
jgi:hypothetical protein